MATFQPAGASSLNSCRLFVHDNINTNEKKQKLILGKIIINLVRQLLPVNLNAKITDQVMKYDNCHSSVSWSVIVKLLTVYCNRPYLVCISNNTFPDFPNFSDYFSPTIFKFADFSTSVATLTLMPLHLISVELGLVVSVAGISARSEIRRPRLARERPEATRRQWLNDRLTRINTDEVAGVDGCV